MTYSPGAPGYPPAQPAPQPSAYAPTTQFPKAEPGPSRLPEVALGLVAAFGLLAYLLSFFTEGRPAESFLIVAVLLAALLAPAGLLPKQPNFAAVAAVIAVLGFLIGISDIVAGSQSLMFILIVVFSFLQMVAAIAALLLDAGVITPPAPRPKYEQYAPYGAPGGYYGQPQGQPQQVPQPQQPPQQAPQGYPNYGGYPGQANAPTQVFAAAPAPAPQPGPPTPPTGFPTYGQPPYNPPAPEQQPQDSSAPSGPPPS